MSDFDISVVCDLTAFIVLPSAIFMLGMLSIVIVEAISVRGGFPSACGRERERNLLSRIIVTQRSVISDHVKLPRSTD